MTHNLKTVMRSLKLLSNHKCMIMLLLKFMLDNHNIVIHFYFTNVSYLYSRAGLHFRIIWRRQRMFLLLMFQLNFLKL